MKFHKGLAYFFFLLSIEALGCAVFLLSIPADPKNSILWGFSLPRLTLFFIFLSIMPTGAILGYRSLNKKRLVSFLKHRILEDSFFRQLSFLVMITVFTAALYGSFLPSYRLGAHLALYQRAQPLLFFTLMVTAQSTVFLMIFGFGFHLSAAKEYLGKDRTIFRKALLLFLIFLILVGIAAFTKLGITPGQIWEKNGIPVLFSQILFLGVLGMWIFFGGKILAKKKPGWLEKLSTPRYEVVIFLAIWLFSGLLWLREPLPYNAVNPGPFPPNNQYYPYSDGAYYYSYTQWARIGQPIPYVDKPIYSAFLFALRLIGGSQFNNLILLQAFLFGILPAVVYLITREISSRKISILLAIGVALQINNSIAASLYAWKISQPKMTMSEIPTAILLALLTYWLIRWFRTRNLFFLLLSGGVFGLSTLVRHNVWLILPVVFILLLFANYPRWKNWISTSLAFSCVLFISIAPWMLRTYQTQGTPFYFLIPFRGVILDERYVDATDMQAASTPAPTDNFSATSVEASTSGMLPSQSTSTSSTVVDRMGSLALTAGNQFMHNLITNVFLMPTQLTFDSLENTIVNHGTPTLYDYTWDGRLSPGTLVMLLFDLLLLAIGIAFALRGSSAGILPLLFFLVYNAAISVANTSGGRYIVPTDWVILFYFLMGLFSLGKYVVAFLGINSMKVSMGKEEPIFPGPNGQNQANFHSYILIAIIFGLIGASPIIFEHLYPARYADQDQNAILQEIQSAGLLEEDNLDQEQLQDFLQQPGAILYQGRAISPRYLDYLDDHSKELFTNIEKDLPQMSFQFIGPTNALVTLPMRYSPEYFPDESDVFVLGCQFDNPHMNAYLDIQIEAFFVIVKQDQQYILYSRRPKVTLTCPVQR